MSGQERSRGQEDWLRNSVEEGTDPRTDHYVFSMHGRDHKTAGTIDVKIGGVGVSGILIDSGATCNIVSKETWESLKRHRVEVKDQRKGSTKLYPYGSSVPLATLGTFTAEVTCPINGAQKEGKFVVLDGHGQDLLCKGTAEELKILKVGPEVNSLEEKLTPWDQKKYKEVFTGIGLFTNWR
ncbi:hypothetical protein Bbelb_109300 [Branchiostoma belcheri]|nr:hypothetical protein Bbelb_109300 [Branchiostoma belcheri]